MSTVTRDPHYTPFGPRMQPRTERPTEPLWELSAAGRVITCSLLNHGDFGVEAQLFSGGEFRSGRRFQTRAEAVEFGESERARLLKHLGGTR